MYDQGTDEADSGWGSEPGWDDAQRGLRTCFRGLVAFCVVIGGAVLGAVVGVSAIAVDGPEGSADFFTFFQVYSIVGWIAVLAIMIAGINRWRRLPETTTARGLATRSLWWSVAYLGLNVIGIFLLLPKLGDPVTTRQGSAFDTIISVVSYAAMAGAILTFQSSLARAATAVGRLDIAAIARRVVTVSGIVMSLGVAMVVVTRVATGGDPYAIRGVIGVISLIAIGACGLGVWALVDVMRVISMLRKGIRHEISIVDQF